MVAVNIAINVRQMIWNSQRNSQFLNNEFLIL